MPIARCITRYRITMTEDHQFDSWALQASHDMKSWITIHLGKSVFIGSRSFNVTNSKYYEYYRIKVYNWIGSPGIPELDFYEKEDDYTTTTSTYTTTTWTTTVSSTSNTYTFSTTYTTQPTTATTTFPIFDSPKYLNLSGNGSQFELVWESSSLALYYELQVRYDNGVYAPFEILMTNIYQGRDIPPTVDSFQFRIRYHYGSTYVSPWTESNVIQLSKINVNFRLLTEDSRIDKSNESYIRISQLGVRVQFEDISSSSHGDIVEWNWKFYMDGLGKSDYYSSNLKNPYFTYLIKGLYAIELTVTDSTGRSETLFKKNYIEVACKLTANFYAYDLETQYFESLEIPYGSKVHFMDFSGPETVIKREWEFCEFPSYGGACSTSSLKSPIKQYNTPGSYAVGLSVTGEYGQKASIYKNNFINVINESSTSTTSTTWIPQTFTTSTQTTESTTVTTTSPPEGWIRIPLRGGIPLCDSFEIGNEPYRAFDGNDSTEWIPINSTTTTTVTSTSTTSRTTYSTTTITTDFFYDNRDIENLWNVNTDISDFRERFINLVTPKNVYKIKEFDVLPPFHGSYIGSVIYVRLVDTFYVGLESSWAKINPDYVLHVLSHTNQSDQLISYGIQPPQNLYPGILWIVPDTTTTTQTTVTTTTATTIWIGNEALEGVGRYPQCSTFEIGHEAVKSFDSDQLTYWTPLNQVSEKLPEWIGFFWTTPKVIKWYKLYVKDTGIPITWSFLASKNGITWVTLDYRYKEDINEWNWYSIDNDTGYYYYRLVITETNDNTKPKIFAFEMFQSVSTTTSSNSTTTGTTTGIP